MRFHEGLRKINNFKREFCKVAQTFQVSCLTLSNRLICPWLDLNHFNRMSKRDKSNQAPTYARWQQFFPSQAKVVASFSELFFSQFLDTELYHFCNLLMLQNWTIFSPKRKYISSNFVCDKTVPANSTFSMKDLISEKSKCHPSGSKCLDSKSLDVDQEKSQ